MLYYFVSDQKGHTHIIVAKSIESARQLAENSSLEIVDLYKLSADTFKDEGFLISNTRRP